MNSIAYDYAPIIYLDKMEPFGIKKVGFEEYTSDGARSKSFNRTFDFLNFEGAVKVLEYTYYLDYDIQHLYDLEHIWVYLDESGNVVGAEGSYHGRFLRAYGRGSDSKAVNVSAAIADGKHIVMYSQPGKHAMLARPELMYLYSELNEACERLAGIHGLDAPDRYLTEIHITEADNQKIVSHIRVNYSFRPSMEFERFEIPKEDYMEVEELQRKIPMFLKEELDRLRIVYG